MKHKPTKNHKNTMTKKELKQRVELGVCVHGHFKVTITYRGEKYTATSTDTLAYETIRSEYCDYPETDYYTVKQAMQALYDECKMRNGLIMQM